MSSKVRKILNKFRQMSILELEEFVEASADTDEKLAVIHHLALQYGNRHMTVKMLPLVEAYCKYADASKDDEIIAHKFQLLGVYHIIANRITDAVDYLEKGMQYLEHNNDYGLKANMISVLASAFNELGQVEKGKELLIEAYRLTKKSGESANIAAYNVAVLLAQLNEYEEALRYFNEAIATVDQMGNDIFKAALLSSMGSLHLNMNKLEEAAAYQHSALQLHEKENNTHGVISTMINLAQVYIIQQQFSKAVDKLEKVKELVTEETSIILKFRLNETYSLVYEKQGNYHKALEYYKLTRELNDKIKEEDALKKAHLLEHQLELERKDKEFEVRLANTKLQTLTKIASDIAHEVQNPLQFVNNFSKINLELLDDLDQEPQDAEARTDLRNNCKKIGEHGQRISKIVDQLLEQTRKAEAGELEVDETNPHDFSW